MQFIAHIQVAVGINTTGTMKTSRRNYPRIHHRMPVSVQFPDGNWMRAELINISPNGLLVRFEKEQLDELLAEQRRNASAAPVQVQLWLEFPLQGSERGMRASCQVLVPRRVSKLEYHVPMVFLEVEPAGVHNLNRFICSERARATA